MELQVPPERVPIRTDTDSVIRVGGTRVTLDTVVAAFHAGATAEEIVQQYPSVTLADVYLVIAYYLRHRSEVRAYLARRQRQAAQVREENDRRFDATGSAIISWPAAGSRRLPCLKSLAISRTPRSSPQDGASDD